MASRRRIVRKKIHQKEQIARTKVVRIDRARTSGMLEPAMILSLPIQHYPHPKPKLASTLESKMGRKEYKRATQQCAGANIVGTIFRILPGIVILVCLHPGSIIAHVVDMFGVRVSESGELLSSCCCSFSPAIYDRIF